MTGENMEIKYCPCCAKELIPISMITYQCPYCNTAFYISKEYSTETIDSIKEYNAKKIRP